MPLLELTTQDLYEYECGIMSTMAMFYLVQKVGCKLCFSRTRASKQGAI